jgi:hypothetical protein
VRDTDVAGLAAHVRPAGRLLDALAAKPIEDLEASTDDLPSPVSITVDHGSDFTSKALAEWA